MCLYRKGVNNKWLACKFVEEQDIDIVQSAFSQYTYYLQKGKSGKAWPIKVNITNYKEIKIVCHLIRCNGGEGESPLRWYSYQRCLTWIWTWWET